MENFFQPFFPEIFRQVIPADLHMNVAVTGMSKRRDPDMILTADRLGILDKLSDPVPRNNHITLLALGCGAFDCLQTGAPHIPHSGLAFIGIAKEHVHGPRLHTNIRGLVAVRLHLSPGISVKHEDQIGIRRFIRK